MDGPPTKDATHQLEELSHAVEDLCRRVTALEQQRVLGPVPAALPIRVPIAEPPAPEVPSGLLPVLGRALFGIAGAYLLRAGTEAGILPQMAGTLLGLAYASAWLAYSLRMAAPNALSIGLQSLTACSLTAGLLWEATQRFHTLSPGGAAAALMLFVVLGQVISWRPGLSMIAAVTAVAGSATMIVLVVATLDPAPFALGMVIVAAVVEARACRDQALKHRWIIALAVDFCVILMMYLLSRPQGLPEGYAPFGPPLVILIQLALVVIYGGSLLIRTVALGLRAAWFETAQTTLVAALAIGTGLQASHTGTSVGIVCLALGAICYWIAFAGPAKRIPGNFHIFAAYGLLLAIFGSALLFDATALTVGWSSLALAMTLAGERTNKNTLRLHAVVFLAAAAARSGLLWSATERMIGSHQWSTVAPASFFCAVAIPLCYAAAIWQRRSGGAPWNQRAASAALAALLWWNTAGLLAGALIGDHLEPPVVSTIRTALIAAGAIALAWFGRSPKLSELIWILYPWMTFGALKLFAEDFRIGRPAMLVVSLLLYGGTLIAIPRLLRRAADPVSRQ